MDGSSASAEWAIVQHVCPVESVESVYFGSTSKKKKRKSRAKKKQLVAHNNDDDRTARETLTMTTTIEFICTVI